MVHWHRRAARQSGRLRHSGRGERFHFERGWQLEQRGRFAAGSVAECAGRAPSEFSLPANQPRPKVKLRCPMKIGSLSVTNFTVFDKADLDLSTGVNVLIGANGTGKSH